MHVMVTGGTGFLGRYIVERLVARGDRVTALVRREDPHLLSLGVELVLGDLSEARDVARACEGADTVFHVAARAGLAGPWEQYYQPNVLGTENVLAACKATGVERLIFTSSPSVTFAGVDQQNVDETAPYPTRWLAHYPHSKALAEQAVLAANDDDGLLTCALRPHLIWGPRDAHLIPKLIARARTGRLRRVGDGENLIDTIYVENAAEAHLQACDALSPGSTVAGQAYFLSQGAPVNCWDWIDEILHLAGLPPVRRAIPFRAAWTIGMLCEGWWNLAGLTHDPPMTRFLAAQLATHHWFNISKAHRDFGYRPRISQQEGMQRLASEMESVAFRSAKERP